VATAAEVAALAAAEVELAALARSSSVGAAAEGTVFQDCVELTAVVLVKEV
jgi:hypothetical protein